jgi:lipid-A-disaccharide synthase
VEFVGHPLLEELDLDSARPGARGALSLDADCPLLAVMPGARGQVVKRLLPVFMRAARELRSLVPDLAVAVGTPDGSPLPGSTDRVHELAPPVNSHDLLRDATAGLFASGTVTLEAALFGVPGVVGYKMGLLNYAIGRSVLRVPHISLANIILGEQVYPELIQRRLTPAAAAAEVLRLLKEPERRARASEMLRRVRERLGTPGASARAAEAVLGLIG